MSHQYYSLHQLDSNFSSSSIAKPSSKNKIQVLGFFYNKLPTNKQRFRLLNNAMILEFYHDVKNL